MLTEKLRWPPKFAFLTWLPGDADIPETEAGETHIGEPKPALQMRPDLYVSNAL